MCVGVSVWLGWSGIRVAGFSRNSNTHQTKNNTTNVVIQQNSRKLLMMDILMSETCWAHKKWSKIANCASACNTDTTPTQPHRNSNTHRTKNNTTNVVIQQNSCKFLMMDILMSETCWANKKWNKIASDIKLIFYSSAILLNIFLSNTESFCVILSIRTHVSHP